MIDAIENSAYAVWVRESPSIWAYTWILSLHAMGLAIVVGINTIVALRLLGYVPDIPINTLRKLFPWMYVGFTVNAFSGLSLLAANLEQRPPQLDVLREAVDDRAARWSTSSSRRPRCSTIPPSSTTRACPRASKRFAIASIVFWSLAIIAGRLTEYPAFVQAWFGF